MCRSRRELSNEYLLAKFDFDTAENEPCKICPLSAYRSPRYLKCKYAHKEGPGLLRAETHRVLGEDITDWVHHYIRNPIDKLEKRFCCKSELAISCVTPRNSMEAAHWNELSEKVIPRKDNI